MPLSNDLSHYIVDATDNGKTYALSPLVYVVLDTPIPGIDFRITFVKIGGKDNYISSSLGIGGCDDTVYLQTEYYLTNVNQTVTLAFDDFNGRWQIIYNVGRTTFDNNDMLSFRYDSLSNKINIPQFIAHEDWQYNTRINSSSLPLNIVDGPNDEFTANAGYANVAIGSSSLSLNGTKVSLGVSAGNENVAVGYEALRENTGGHSNTVVGSYSLQSNITGGYNVSIGSRSMASNTIGSYNTSAGYRALESNTTGANNIAIGYSSLRNSISQSVSIAIGDSALGSQNGVIANTYNIGIGSGAGAQITTGIKNISIGWGSGGRNQTGDDNTYLGTLSGAGSIYYSTGDHSINRNTTVGAYSLQNQGDGDDNTAIGYGALSGGLRDAYNAYNSSANVSQNTAIGSNALFNNRSNQNTAIGMNAGTSLITGTNNIVIGYNANGLASSTSNSVTLGNTSITTLRCAVTSITSLSDQRDKTDIIPLRFGLDFINTLNPVEFTWNTRDQAKIGIKASGFLAQDLKTAQEAVSAQEILDLISEENPDKLEARYGNLIPSLVKAIQDLSLEINILKLQLERSTNV